MSGKLGFKGWKTKEKHEKGGRKVEVERRNYRWIEKSGAHRQMNALRQVVQRRRGTGGGAAADVWWHGRQAAMAATVAAAIAAAGTAEGHLVKVHQRIVADAAADAKAALYRLHRLQVGQCILKAATAITQSVLRVILLQVCKG